jgi:mRNA interferase MazF
MPSTTTSEPTPGDLVLVPFAFTDQSRSKKRPALVVSPASSNRSGDLTIAFVTSRLTTPPREGDYRVEEWQAAGLPKPSLVRMKFVTLSRALILRTLGRLSPDDWSGFQAALCEFLGCEGPVR